MSEAEEKKCITIGITGTIGSGKSSVGKMLEEMEVPVIDTDKIVHEFLSTDTEVQALIRDRFGESVFEDTASGAIINRKSLGAIVFKDEKARKDLEGILHPRVRATCRKLQTEYAEQGAPAVVALVPLLFEADLKSEYDEVWAIISTETSLRARLKERDKMSEQEIDHRLLAQLSQGEKASKSDRIIDNSHTLSETRKQVKKAIEDALAKKKWRTHWRLRL